MKGCLLTVLLLLFTGASPRVIYAARSESPNVSIGFGGGYGLFSSLNIRGSDDWKTGQGYQGSFIAEKMLSPRLGLHSGICFTSAEYRFSEEDSSSVQDAKIEIQSLSMPLDLITAFSGRRVSLEILTGFNFIYTLSARMHDEANTVNTETDVLNYMNYFNVALEMGLRLRFRLGRYTDMFMGITGDINLLNTTRNTGDGNDYSLLWSARAETGFLFRTNLFPAAGNSGEAPPSSR
jgi:hypothetical protein